MNKKVLGILGALLGGFIFTIPWILVYIFGNMLFSILAAFIAYGVLMGYKKLGGEVNINTPKLVTIISIVVIMVTTLIIIPLCLLYKEGFVVSIHNLQVIYDYPEFRSAIIRDLIISVVFTILGISGVVNKLKSEVDPNFNTNKQNNNSEDISTVKAAFIKYNAMDKYNATSKENILREINNNISLFNRLKLQQIIKKSNGNYYFSEKAEKSVLHRFATLYLKVLAIMLIIMALVIAIMVISQ